VTVRWGNYVIVNPSHWGKFLIADIRPEVAEPIVVSGALGESLAAVIRAARRADKGCQRARAEPDKLAGPVLLPYRASMGPAVQSPPVESLAALAAACEVPPVWAGRVCRIVRAYGWGQS
jgi:hypothetical protein